MEGICKLCRSMAKLEESHIVPKFVYRWINKTSPTGRLRGFKNPNIPYQDGKKVRLLCGRCEDKFSVYETWFATKFFHASIKSVKITYDYDENLFKFFASLFWRTLVIRKDDPVYNESKFKRKIVECEFQLRQFLDKDIYPKDYDHFYIGMTNFVVDAPSDLKGLNFFFTRTVDNQIIFNSNSAYYYSQIPYFIFVGNIAGIEKDNFTNCQINPLGGQFVTSTMRSKDPNSQSHMLDRLDAVNKLKASDHQADLILKSIMANIEKYKSSETFKADFLDGLRDWPNQ